jgi:gamma-glutamyltranspeptidase/glutathione hydrolase
MDIQDAIDAPRFRSYNFPDSFSPHGFDPGKIGLEQELYRDHADALESMGYRIEEGGSWDNEFSAVGAIVYADSGLKAGSDPREATTALGR